MIEVGTQGTDMANAEQRAQHILAALFEHGRVSVKDVAGHFHVSHETVRRDLKQLEQDGHLRCVYGGGVKVRRDTDEPVLDRIRLNAREKARLAAVAATLLKTDLKIFVDAGSTTMAFAKHLRDWPGVTVYTNSLDIVQFLLDAGHPKLFGAGGAIEPRQRGFFGQGTLDLISRHYFDMAFVGIASVDPELGFMDFNADESTVRRALRLHSRQVVMMADASKFGHPSSICTYGFSEIDVLVTDAPVPARFLSKFEQSKVSIIHA